MSIKAMVFTGIIISSCSHNIVDRYTAGIHSSIPKKKSIKQKDLGIDYIDKNRFRIHKTYSRVWDNILDLVLKNYNLNIADKNSGLITTEWDSYYLNNKVFRNKLSIRVKQLNWNMVDVIVYNNVEILADNRETQGPMIWLPENDGKLEIGRLITNLSIVLRVKKPTLPKEYIAIKPGDGEKVFKR